MVPDLKTSYLPKTKYITEHVVYRRENFAHRVIAPGRVFFRRLIKHVLPIGLNTNLFLWTERNEKLRLKLSIFRHSFWCWNRVDFQKSHTQERNIIWNNLRKKKTLKQLLGCRWILHNKLKYMYVFYFTK